MNNSQIVIENILREETPVDRRPFQRQKQEETASIVEAMEQIVSSKYWKLLTDKVFNKDIAKLEDRLRTEKNPTEIYRLQGQITRSKKYDLENESQAYRIELQNLRKQLNENS